MWELDPWRTWLRAAESSWCSSTASSPTPPKARRPQSGVSRAGVRRVQQVNARPDGSLSPVQAVVTFRWMSDQAQSQKPSGFRGKRPLTSKDCPRRRSGDANLNPGENSGLSPVICCPSESGFRVAVVASWLLRRTVRVCPSSATGSRSLDRPVSRRSAGASSPRALGLRQPCCRADPRR